MLFQVFSSFDCWLSMSEIASCSPAFFISCLAFSGVPSRPASSGSPSSCRGQRCHLHCRDDANMAIKAPFSWETFEGGLSHRGRPFVPQVWGCSCRMQVFLWKLYFMPMTMKTMMSLWHLMLLDAFVLWCFDALIHQSYVMGWSGRINEMNESLLLKWSNWIFRIDPIDRRNFCFICLGVPLEFESGCHHIPQSAILWT